MLDKLKGLQISGILNLMVEVIQGQYDGVELYIHYTKKLRIFNILIFLCSVGLPIGVLTVPYRSL